MLYKEVLKEFNTDDVLCILIDTGGCLKAVSEYNLKGGYCGCCEGFSINGDLTVVRVVNLMDMEILYEASNYKEYLK